MSQKKKRVLLVDAENRNVREEFINDYKDILSLIGCQFFDVVEWQLKDIDTPFTIYCDDIGKLKPHIVSGISLSDPNYYLAGNLVISKSDEEGNDVPLTSEECNDIIFKSMSGYQLSDGTSYPLLILK